MRDMSKGRTLLIASAVATAMVVAGVVAVSAAGKSAAPNTFLTGRFAGPHTQVERDFGTRGQRVSRAGDR